MLSKKDKELQAKMARAQVKRDILPKVQAALESGKYQFIAKNAIRIYSLEIEPYEGMENPGELKQLVIDSIEVSWT